MKNILEQIKEAIESPLKKLQITVEDITFEKEGKNYFLKIVLDRPNPLDIDSIVDATNIINPILDELDLIEESYCLDVSSKERG